MKITVPNQNRDGETRVALVPQVAKRLVSEQVQVVVEAGAGRGAGFDDAAYEGAGATVVPSDGEATSAIWSEGDIILTVRPPTVAQAKAVKAGAIVAGSLAPLANLDVVTALRDAKATAFAMEFVPRISRAQSMDVLSSQANIGGYKAVIMAAERCPKMFPMMITAAGTLAPARVFILGAGVAGLQAIATAKRLGAVVEAFDVRAATKEQVQSLGARFIELPLTSAEAETAGGYAKEQSEEQQKRQAELMAKHVTGADVVITTAAVFGKAPPMLVPADVAGRMQRGSVLVDMAADPRHGRGNCEITRPGEVFTTDAGVTIVGTLNLPSLVPSHASLAYANNMQAFLKEILDKQGQLTLKPDDEIQKGACITRDGQITNDLVNNALSS